MSEAKPLGTVAERARIDIAERKEEIGLKKVQTKGDGTKTLTLPKDTPPMRLLIFQRASQSHQARSGSLVVYRMANGGLRFYASFCRNNQVERAHFPTHEQAVSWLMTGTRIAAAPVAPISVARGKIATVVGVDVEDIKRAHRMLDALTEQLFEAHKAVLKRAEVLGQFIASLMPKQ